MHHLFGAISIGTPHSRLERVGGLDAANTLHRRGTAERFTFERFEAFVPIQNSPPQLLALLVCSILEELNENMLPHIPSGSSFLRWH
jgi:hypothetical protein